ncbi:hypothetical protein [Chroococcidiopsis sp.]
MVRVNLGWMKNSWRLASILSRVTPLIGSREQGAVVRGCRLIYFYLFA